jgi:hypothetical protein
MSAPQTIDRVGRIVAALDAYWLAHSCPPTVRELTVQMGLHAYGNISVDLKAAAALGRIQVTHNHAPGLTPHYMPMWIANAINREIRWRAEHVEKDEQWQEGPTP